MISQTATYALRILGFLAERPRDRVQGGEIAGATGIPANYLSKILNQLRKRGLVLSQKGWGGGFQLGPGAAVVAIADVVELFDGKRQKDACAFGRPRCDAANPCPLHHHWERITATFEEMLGAVTIGDLAAPPDRRPRKKSR